jgi:ADP-ribosylglycohydrolase
MTYPDTAHFKKLVEQLELYVQLQTEYGAKGIGAPLTKAAKALRLAVREVRRLPIDRALAWREPNALTAIQALRPAGPRRLWRAFDRAAYADRLAGALLGRLAGCTLGAPVEFNAVHRMEELAEANGDAFPPTDYWTRVPDPKDLRYQMSRRDAYTRDLMNGVPADDDIAYTLLGLLIAEEHGPDFTVADVGRAWVKYLPYACTAEDIALKNLRNGLPAEVVGERNNPYCEWIGADIRADPWGYMAPGWPARAAAMAYTDAYISHRRQGIYGEMFFAAAIAAAFAVDDPVEALRLGLTEIPRQCALAQAVRWALRMAPGIKDYRQARAAMEARFKTGSINGPHAGMHPVHTINNACLTVWGITIGGRDFTRVIGETVAMGMDNDCTAATAGSIVGAVVGKKGIPDHWHRNFRNTIHSYLIGKKRFAISGLLKRFEKQAKTIHARPCPGGAPAGRWRRGEGSRPEL